jgi:YidC/Oxa1 family membrane protein insertase
MNKVTLYLFPIGVIVGGAVFPFPIGLLVYWLANNSWTLMQQNVVYSKIDQEEEEKKVIAVEKRNSLAPKPGQKPAQAKKKPAATNPVESTEPETAIESTDEAESATPTNGQATKGTTGQAKAKSSSNGSDADTTVPGLISDRARTKKSGRRNR